MSRWIERWVFRSMMVVASILVLVALSAAARAEQNEETASPEARDTSEKAVERPMISTGLDSESIAANWPGAAVWLEPPDEARVLALFEPEADVPAKGAVVILADEGQSPASGLAGALRPPMARAGWAVMVLGLETPPYALQEARRQRNFGPSAESGMPKTGAPDEAPEESANEGESVMIDVMASDDVEALEDRYRTRVQKTLAVAVGNLVDRGYNQIALVGIGRAAAHVTRVAAASEGGAVSALVWIAPELDQSESEALEASLETAGSLRVLELHSARSSSGDGEMAQWSPKQREAAFKRAGITGYSRQPVAMSEQPQPRKAPALTNRISAWLTAKR